MKILLDTDVLMDVALGRPDFGPDSRAALDWCARCVPEHVNVHLRRDRQVLLVKDLDDETLDAILNAEIPERSRELGRLLEIGGNRRKIVAAPALQAGGNRRRNGRSRQRRNCPRSRK